MVYDFTESSPILHAQHGEPGYAIYKDVFHGRPAEFVVFTDDGRGNGNLVCRTPDPYWARRIAHSLDLIADGRFDAVGNVR